MIKVLSIFGTRPEAIKMAPLCKELEKRQLVKSLVCVTAQHREMLDQVLCEFQIKPDCDLDIMRQGQTLTEIMTGALAGIDKCIKEIRPHVVLVHGDTSTTFVASLAAFYNQTMVGHVEAGLRTYDKYSPFPEEMNRQLTGVLADIHFCPTIRNKMNLINEGKEDEHIYVTGNTVIDSLKYTVKDGALFKYQPLNEIDVNGKRLILVTAHRRENLGNPLKDILGAVKGLACNYDDIVIVYPVHKNPIVQKTANEILGGVGNVHLIDPVEVSDLHNLIKKSYMVLTDSGGLQEEAPAMGKPVLVLRNETERPEAVTAGTVKLAGVDRDDIYRMSAHLLDNTDEYKKMAQATNPYGDGNASRRIADAILYEFGEIQTRPEQWNGKGE